MSKGRIVCMEDDSGTRRAYERMLPMLGYEVTAFENGKDGLAEIERMIQAGQPPDIILTDQSMPLMTGVEVLRALKASHPEGIPPVVMVSGEPEISQALISEGINVRFLAKPLDFPKLIAALESILPPGAQKGRLAV